jgi:16S rRNA processing protein RimM
VPDRPADEIVLLGRVIGVFGLGGWVKVFSDTRAREDILQYCLWQMRLPGGDWQPRKLLAGRFQHGNVLAQLEGVTDRSQAERLVGYEIGVPRSALPALSGGEYYWSDLEGLRVVNLKGVEFGQVSHLFETGANDVMVVQGERERLLPCIPDVLKQIDLDARCITVDWDEDF